MTNKSLSVDKPKYDSIHIMSLLPQTNEQQTHLKLTQNKF